MRQLSTLTETRQKNNNNNDTSTTNNNSDDNDDLIVIMITIEKIIIGLDINRGDSNG